MPPEEGAVSKRQGEKHHRADDTVAERRPPPRKAIKPGDPGERASAIKATAQAGKIEVDAATPAAHPLTRRQAQRRIDTFRFRSPLWPRPHQRLVEASSTIHLTSSSKVIPTYAASSGTSDVSVMPGWVLISRQTSSPVPRTS